MYTDREKADVLRRLGYSVDVVEPTREQLAEMVLILIDTERRRAARRWRIGFVVGGIIGLAVWHMPGCQEDQPQWTSGAPGGNVIGAK